MTSFSSLLCVVEQLPYERRKTRPPGRQRMEPRPLSKVVARIAHHSRKPNVREGAFIYDSFHAPRASRPALWLANLHLRSSDLAAMQPLWPRKKKSRSPDRGCDSTALSPRRSAARHFCDSIFQVPPFRCIFSRKRRGPSYLDNRVHALSCGALRSRYRPTTLARVSLVYSSTPRCAFLALDAARLRCQRYPPLSAPAPKNDCHLLIFPLSARTCTTPSHVPPLTAISLVPLSPSLPAFLARASI